MNSPSGLKRMSAVCATAATLLCTPVLAFPVKVPQPGLVGKTEMITPGSPDVFTEDGMRPVASIESGVWRFDQDLTDRLRKLAPTAPAERSTMDFQFKPSSSLEVDPQGIAVWMSWIDLHSACSYVEQDVQSFSLYNCTSVGGKPLDAKSQSVLADVEVIEDGAALVAKSSVGTIWAFSR